MYIYLYLSKKEKNSDENKWRKFKYYLNYQLNFLFLHIFCIFEVYKEKNNKALKFLNFKRLCWIKGFSKLCFIVPNLIVQVCALCRWLYVRPEAVRPNDRHHENIRPVVSLSLFLLRPCRFLRLK